jgi:hypothetical protein
MAERVGYALFEADCEAYPHDVMLRRTQNTWFSPTPIPPYKKNDPKGRYFMYLWRREWDTPSSRPTAKLILTT